jgi:L-cysteine desulfidase
MSVAGSGNHGITAFLGIKAICDVYEIDEERMLRAIAFTILITAYIKMETGVLSAMCGCGVAAGIGLSAGITYILNGDLVDISGAMMNMVGSISGIICDGAKEGCALKLALASGWAVECSILALNKMVINSTDGIVNSDFRKLFSNLGIICSACGLSVNQEIVKILENNRVELL